MSAAASNETTAKNALAAEAARGDVRAALDDMRAARKAAAESAAAAKNAGAAAAKPAQRAAERAAARTEALAGEVEDLKGKQLENDTVTNDRLGALEKNDIVTNDRLGALEEDGMITNDRLGGLENAAGEQYDYTRRTGFFVENMSIRVAGVESATVNAQATADDALSRAGAAQHDLNAYKATNENDMNQFRADMLDECDRVEKTATEANKKATDAKELAAAIKRRVSLMVDKLFTPSPKPTSRGGPSDARASSEKGSTPSWLKKASQAASALTPLGSNRSSRKPAAHGVEVYID